MAASLPRRGTTSPCFYSDVSCVVVTSGKNIRRNMFCVNELVTIMDYKKSESVHMYVEMGRYCFLEMSVASCLSALCLFESPELIENVKLIHKPVSLQPRGLINKGNWCYINAVSFHSLCWPLNLLFIWLNFPNNNSCWISACLTFGWATSFWLGLKAKEHKGQLEPSLWHLVSF